MSDARLVLINKTDNVLVCCGKVSAQETVEINRSNFTMPVDINVGHKVARNDIKKGDKIIKYGAAIGSSTKDIGIGEHVHIHNIQSDYIPSHTRASKVGII